MGDETPGWNEESALRWAPDRRHAFNASAAPLEKIRTGPWSPRPELPREEPVVTAPTVIQAWPWRIAIGAAQGLLFFALVHTRALNQWPGGDPWLFTALVLVGPFVPLLLLEGIGVIAPRRLLPFAGIAAGALAGLGWYHHWRLDGAEHNPSALWLLGLCALALVIVQAALHARERGDSWRVPYADLFTASWTLAARLFFWALLTLAGAGLLTLAHLPVLEGDARALALLALVSALAFQAARPRIVEAIRLALVAAAILLLPMACAMALVFISIAFAQGAVTLAWLLPVLGALTLAISASHGDGAALVRSPWRGGFEVFGSILALVLAIIALLALDTRVAALGWTSARVCAAIAVAFFLAYGAGYTAAAIVALWRDGTMRLLEKVNVVMGGALLVTAIALASPLADPLRLASEAQVARLELGHADVGGFDFGNLQRDGARFGAAALSRLAGSLYPDISRAAAAARGPDAAPLPAREVGPNITLRTPGAQLPATLLARDWSPVLGVPGCLSTPRESCDAWFRDLNGDGRQEILLASGGETRWWVAVMQADEAGRWSLAGRLASGCGATLTNLRADLRAGRFDTLSALPGWNELSIAGNKVAAGVPEAGCSHY
jgi:hypothetical protein